MDILNMNLHQVSVRCKDEKGNIDFVTVAARRRITLPGYLVVDTNWLATQTKIKTFADTKSSIKLDLQQATKEQKPISPPEKPAALTTSPADDKKA
jgi:hypothetical protein